MERHSCSPAQGACPARRPSYVTLDKDPPRLCPSAKAGGWRQWDWPHHFLSPLQLVLDQLLVIPGSSCQNDWCTLHSHGPQSRCDDSPHGRGPPSTIKTDESAHTPVTMSFQACSQGSCPKMLPVAGWGSGKGRRKAGRALGLGVLEGTRWEQGEIMARRCPGGGGG